MSRYLSALIFGAAMLAACNFHDDKDVAGENGGPSAPPAVGETIPGYAELKTQVFDSCVACHGSAPAGNDLSLHTYALVKANLTIIKKRAVTDKNMPPQGLPAADVATLSKWIDAGAPETATTVTSTATATETQLDD